MNITNRTPLAGVKLFQSSTYPSDGIDLYWRGNDPISFELSDSPDRGDAYPHFLAHIDSFITTVEAKSFTLDDHSILTAKIFIDDHFFYITQDDDIVTLSTTPPVLVGQYVPNFISEYQAEILLLVIKESLLAVTFSPVDLAWLCGYRGRGMGLYDSKIWGEACRRLPDNYFLDLIDTAEGILLEPK